MKHVFKIENGKYTKEFTDKFIEKHQLRCFVFREYDNGATRVFLSHGDVQLAVANLKWGVLSRVFPGKSAEGLVLVLNDKKYILLSKHINHPTNESIKRKNRKILLITNYWYPWNCSGSFRWVHIGEHLEFDVLTCKKPRKGMYDETMPGKNHRVFRHGRNLPALLFGLFITCFVIFIRKNYQKIIFSSPPESLLIPAWICQKLGSDVYIDVRDDIARKNNTNKRTFPVHILLTTRTSFIPINR